MSDGQTEERTVIFVRRAMPFGIFEDRDPPKQSYQIMLGGRQFKDEEEVTIMKKQIGEGSAAIWVFAS